MNPTVNNLLVALNSIGRAFCGHAAGVFVQCALLVIVLYAVDLLLRKRVRAVFRYCLWLLVLVKLVLPPTLSLPTGVGYWTADHLPAALSVSSRPFDAPGLGHMGIFLEEPHAAPSGDHTEEAPLVAATDTPVTPLTWQAILFVIWLAGVLAFLALLIQRARFVRALIIASTPATAEFAGVLEQCRRQIGIRVNTGLRISETVSSPAVCGFFRPIILIPAAVVGKLSPEGLRAILIHELAHIKRGDLWVNFIQTFLQVIYFYNPFVWFANSVIRRACEEAVDETVLVTLGGEARDYSNTLIDIGEMAFWRADLGLRLIGVAESKKALQWRIRHMLTRPIPKSSKLGLLSIAGLVATAAILLPMAKAEKSGQDHEPATNIEISIPLHQAAKDGDLERVKRLIAEGADVNVGGDWTALHEAACNGHTDIIELLIANGANVNASPIWSPLHETTTHGHNEATRALVANGAKLDVKDSQGMTPFHNVLFWGNPDLVKLFISKGIKLPDFHLSAFKGDLANVKRLLEKGANVDTTDDQLDWTALHWAAFADTTEIAEFLLAKGADINAKGLRDRTPLHVAVIHRKVEIAELLVSHGADIHVEARWNTPLSIAVENGDTAMAEMLAKHAGYTDAQRWIPLHIGVNTGDRKKVEEILSQGANINVADDYSGYTALHWAVLNGHKSMVEMLIAKGADINAKGGVFGATPIQYAAGHREIVDILLAEGADIYAKDRGGGTAMHYLAWEGMVDVMSFLLEKGWDIEATNFAGGTPLGHAVINNQVEAAEFLIDQGANVNVRYNQDTSYLHKAVQNANFQMVELLLGAGADVDVRTRNGQTPLDLAKEKGQTEIVELLRKRGPKE